MISFRDKRMNELELDLIIHINQDGLNKIFSHGSEIHTRIMKTDALKQAL